MLLAASVLCPVASAWIYLEVEPFSNQQLASIAVYKWLFGNSADLQSLPASQDWHILLAGVSFGFLCLAAANGLLKQRANELVLVSRMSTRISYFETGLAIFDIKGVTGEQDPEEAVPFVMDYLKNAPMAEFAHFAPSIASAQSSESFQESLAKALAAAVTKQSAN